MNSPTSLNRLIRLMRSFIGENFHYIFKGARSAPCAWRRMTAHAARAE